MSQEKYLDKVWKNVNLGNIPLEEILALKALSRELRRDILKRAYPKRVRRKRRE